MENKKRTDHEYNGHDLESETQRYSLRRQRMRPKATTSQKIINPIRVGCFTSLMRVSFSQANNYPGNRARTPENLNF
jgi:hypothetical protein